MAYNTVTQHPKLYPYTSIMAAPYSCDPTGAIDCAAAIEQIKTNQSNVGTIYIPHGTFLINTNLTIPTGMALMFERGGVFSVSVGKTLTVNGTIIAGAWTIISGTGSVSIAAGTNAIIHGEWVASWATPGVVTINPSVTLANLAGAGGFVKNSAAGLLSGNNSISMGDIDVATTSAAGIAELATNAECQTGVDTTRIVTPSGLASVTASETRAGLVERATDAEAAAMVDTSRYVTPAHLALLGSTSLVQVVYTTYNTYTTVNTVIPLDDTIPQITEGAELFTVAITPTNAANILTIKVVVWGAISAGGAVIALFQDATANALAAAKHGEGANNLEAIPLTHIMVAGTVAATTFRVRSGPSAAGNFYVNGTNVSRMFGGILNSSIIITETTP